MKDLTAILLHKLMKAPNASVSLVEATSDRSAAFPQPDVHSHEEARLASLH